MPLPQRRYRRHGVQHVAHGADSDNQNPAGASRIGRNMRLLIQAVILSRITKILLTPLAAPVKTACPGNQLQQRFLFIHQFDPQPCHHKWSNLLQTFAHWQR